MTTGGPHTGTGPGEGGRICGAKTKAGTPCQVRPMPNGRCYRHGGASLSGIAHPNYQGKGYSKVLPTRLVSVYEQAVNDPELLSMRHQLAVHLARYTDLLGRVDTGESSKFYDRLTELAKEYDQAGAEEREEAWRRLRGMIKAGRQDWMTWLDVERTLATILKLADYEKRRLMDMEAMLTADEVMTLLGLVLHAVRDHVTDPRELQAVQNTVLAALDTRKAAIAAGARG